MRNLTVNGRLGGDAQEKISANGRKFIYFSLASTEYGDPKDSEGKPITQWYRVTSFVDSHFNLMKYLTKGKPVIVTGRYNNHLYTSQKDGSVGIDNSLVAFDISFEAGSERNDDGAQNGTAPKTQGVSSASLDSIPQVTSAKMTAPPQPQSSYTQTVSAPIDDDLPF